MRSASPTANSELAQPERSPTASHWLNFVEYALLTSTGIGAAAAILLEQLLYALMPLSLLVATGLWNRQRVDRLTQDTTQAVHQSVLQRENEFTQKLDQVEATVHNRPSQQAFITFQQSMLKRNHESLARFDRQQEVLERQLAEYRQQVEQLGLEHLEHDMGELHQHYSQIGATVDDLATQVAQLPNPKRVEAMETTMTDMRMQMMRLRVSVDNLHHETRGAMQPLQDYINSVSLQLNHLSRRTDNSTLKADIEELIKTITNLVPRQDFLTVADAVEELKQQQRALASNLTTMGDTLRTVTQDGLQVNDRQHTQLAQVSQLQQEVTDLKSGLNDLTAQLQRSQPAQVIEQVLRQIPKTLDMAALHSQVQGLAQQVDETTQQLLDCQRQLTGVTAVQSHQHQLVFDLARSPAPPASSVTTATDAVQRSTLLEHVFAEVQQRLILICPWSSQVELDAALIQQFQTLLERGVRLDVGWCHRGDRREGRFLSTIAQRWLAAATQRQSLQQVLNQLLPLKQQYPEQFRFKILGTDEQFLVCDRRFAILGMQDLPLNNTIFPDLQAWLRTTDSTVIQQLMHRFNRPQIDEADPAAFFNRATTQYDLSDWSSALEDYNQVIRLIPTDAIAHNNRGIVRYDLDDLNGALTDFTQAIRLDPTQAVTYCNRGILYSERGEFALAIADFTQAITRMTDSPIPYFYRGTVYKSQAQFALAQEDFTQAIHYAPQAAFLYCYRAALAQTLGQTAAAIADLETAIAQFNDQGDTVSAQRVRRTLRSLRVQPLAAVNRSAT